MELYYAISVHNITDVSAVIHSSSSERNGPTQEDEPFKALDNPLYSSTEVPEHCNMVTENLSASKESMYCLAGPSSDEGQQNSHTHTPEVDTINSGSAEDMYDYAYVWTVV